MRLRLTVRRNGLPETPVVWNVDLETCTISQLLEQVNEAIPIESGDWGFEDYAVELKGNNGVNYECLHYQVLGKVMKEDDEVIIRPLLTQDIKIRRVSGRNQISSDGKHLLDGLAFGRPLLRRPADRPPVNIPPLKKRRITYDEEHFSDEDDEGVKALEDKEEPNENSDHEENNDRQLILHADFDDDDSENDEDFAPGEDDDNEASAAEAGADSDQDEQPSDEAADEEEVGINAPNEVEELDDADEPGLRGVLNPRRAMIRKLHSAFPTSSIAVCKYMLEGTDGDIDRGYDAMAIGFRPAIHKGAITETSQENLDVLKPRSKKRKQIEEPEEQDSMQVEFDDSMNPLADYFDQNGLPPGSISSGKALFVMAKDLKNSPARVRRGQRGTVGSTKSVKSSRGGSFSNDITSTPFIDRDSHIKHADEDEVSSDTSSSGSSSEDEDEVSSDTSSSGSLSEDESEAAQVSDNTSTSGSDISDSSDSRSDSDDEPEATSSKPSSASLSTPNKAPNTSAGSAAKQPQQNLVPSEMGMKSTRTRNQRRRQANLLKRYKAKGILPAGTTLRELSQLGELDEETSPEDALIALEAVRSAQKSDEVTDLTGHALEKAKDFEARRQELLDSLKSGGIDVEQEFSLNRASSAVQEESNISVNRSVNTTASEKNSRLPSKATEPPQAAANSFKEGSVPPFKPSEQSDVAITASRASKLPAKVDVKSKLINTSSKIVGSLQAKALDVPEALGTPSRSSRSPSKTRESLSVSNTPSIKASKPPHVEGEPEVDASSESNTAKANDERPCIKVFSTALETPRRTLIEESAIEESAKIHPKMAEALQTLEAVKETTPDGTAQSKTPTPSAGLAKGAVTTPRRSKLDLGAGRRLLFNALGMRAPKTQKDEDKLRSDLMKNVRPLVTPKPVEEASKDMEGGADEDPESWREKINYRAVECCQNGVALSEPPFPFVQRWDPQQQGGWFQKGKRGGKRKQDMRDQSQYYETQRLTKKQKHRKNKHRYAEEQEYWEGDFEPSYQEDSIGLGYGEPSQDVTIQSDNFGGSVDEQFMDGLNKEASPANSRGPADLAVLPQDPLTLPDLERGQAVPGMTIAFKHLIMDEKSWSPLVSPWVTAIVIKVFHTDLLHLTLAIRDRKMPEDNYDEETGSRIYGKFEMPAQSEDDDDDEEDDKPIDDGHLEISYRGLMKPKIVQEAPAHLVRENTVYEASQAEASHSPRETVTSSHKHEEESVEAQFSHVTETPLHSDAPFSPEQDDNEPSQDSPQADQEIEQTQLDSTESEIPSHQPDVTQEPETAPNEEMDESQQSDDEYHEALEQSYPSELNPEPNLGDKTTPEGNDKQPNAEFLPDGTEQSFMNEKSDLLEKADKSAAWNGVENGPTTLAPGGTTIAACPMCNTSLEGISPGLASKHVNSCLDGKPVPLPEPARQAEATPAAASPKNDTPPPDADRKPSPEPLSEEDRQEISRLIKDAGFRSAIDPSILRDVRPEGVVSSGDAAILMKSMEATEDRPSYSPKYSGLGSSPSRNPSLSATKRQQLSSAPRGTQSSWQTADAQFLSSQPSRLEPELERQVEVQLEEERENEGSWETIEDPTSPPKKRNKKKTKKITKSTAFGEAQRLWESLQAMNYKPNASLSVENKQPSPPPKVATGTPHPNRKTCSSPSDAGNVNLPATEARSHEERSAGWTSKLTPESDTQGLDGAEERDATSSAQYPKLSVGSSFTSMVSDHGRQPDISLDDSEDLNMDTPEAVYFTDDDYSFQPENDAMTSAQPESLSRRVTRQAFQRSNPIPEDAPIPPVKKLTKARSPSPISDESDSDYDPFPPLEQLTQSQLQVKREKFTSGKGKGPSKDELEYMKAMDALDDADLSDENQSTPKASQKTTRKSVFKAPAVRVSKSKELPPSHVSTSQDSEPRAPQNQSRISASQPNPSIINLISSDTDNDDDEAESSGDVLKIFKKPSIEDYDEVYRSGQNGWVKKSSAGRKAQRHTRGTNLRASSQTTFNTKNARKTSRS